MSQTLTAISAAASKRLGLPDDLKIASAFPFAGMNQQDARTAIADQEFFWIENYLLTGAASMRTLWDIGQALYTAPFGKTIVYFAWYNIGSAYYVAVFLSDGTAVQVQRSNGAVTTISATPGTFYSGDQLPFAVQSGAQYLLICNNINPNAYWIWDGAILYSTGSVGPYQIGDITDSGSGYTSAPTVTPFGGSGAGLAVTATVVNGGVVSLQVTNPGSGYSPGDVPQLAFSGGGSDTSAILTAVLSSGAVGSLTLVSGGSGYPTGTFALGFSGGGGSGATGNFTTSGGAVVSLVLTAGGSGYTSTPTVSFPIPGSGGSITATESGGAVDSLSIVSGGSGYTPGTYPLAFSGGAGTGAQATYTVNVSGVIDATTIVAGGTGYTSGPTVAIPTGSGAAAVASLTAGSVASVTVVNGGTGYNGTPTLTFSGGGGTGATATVTLSSGAIASVDVTDGGAGYVEPPAVIVGTGFNNAASAQLDTMPFGISGTCIETFLSRVWISAPAPNGTPQTASTFYLSAPESPTDFASSDGGLLYSSSDRFLRSAYTSLHQSNGYLYPIGDSSVDVISNVQTSGSPLATTFNYQNTSPQIGATWRDTVQDFGQSVLFANANGICGLYGGAVRRVSSKVNNIFATAFPNGKPLPGALTPSAAVANIYTIPVYLLLMTIIDPNTQAKRNVMIGWDEKNWIAASQSTDLTFIATQEQNSVLTAWGTDGTGLYPLFNAPSASLMKTLVTKLYGGEREMIAKETLVMYYRATDMSAAQGGVKITAACEAMGFNTQIGAYPAVAAVNSAQNPVNPNFLAPIGTAPSWGGQAANAPGTAIGAAITTTSDDFLLSGVSIAYREITAYFG